ncbi:hypothetical protein LCGC14_1603820 [marine sediment metagenome]|uniref:Uncharacterized protein n=1 Tax=marine sediment metagenome TaxID=412755 RepID=A0A0F9IWY9_9ZZZZ
MTKYVWIADKCTDQKCFTCYYYKAKSCWCAQSNHCGHVLMPTHEECKHYIRVEKEKE